MASIALRNIGSIDYLAYGSIFTRAMFLPKKKGDVFFPARKAADERWGVVGGHNPIFATVMGCQSGLMIKSEIWYF